MSCPSSRLAARARRRHAFRWYGLRDVPRPYRQSELTTRSRLMAEDGPAGQEQTPRAAGETTMIHRVETTIGGRTLSLETGRVAEQAGGAVLARYGETVLLAAATTSASPREGIDFFPLTVDVEERLYAAGKIPGGFIKREGRPTEHSILASRLVDRPIRPLFPKGYRNDVQVVITVLSADMENDPNVIGITAASAALAISD